MSYHQDLLSGVRVLSFDVFDTLVVRASGPPEALFLLLGRWARDQGLTEFSPESFARRRARAEASVWEQRGGLDTSVHLTDFYVEMARRSGFSERLVGPLVDAELHIEARVLRPNPVALEWLRRGRDRGVRVIAVSDIYLTSEEVLRLLRPLGVEPSGGLFTSHDAQASKVSGRLYARVTEEIGVRPEEILHLGDKLGVDVRRAREAGWRALWLPAGQLTRHESGLADSRWENGGLGAALAGAARLSRLESGSASQHERDFVAVGAAPAAALVIGYVLWVLERARAHGLERLGFLARDGQILAAVAETLVTRLGLDIDIRYLQVSRQATNLAGVYALTSEDLGWILRHANGHSVDEILERVGLTAHSLPELPVGIDGGTQVSDHVRSVLAGLLLRPSTTKMIDERARAQRRVVSEYLRAQSFLDPGRATGIVDLGGVGSQVRALFNIISMEADVVPRIFLLGLDQHPDHTVREAVLSSSWLPQTECWIYDQVREVGEIRYRGLISMAHVCCAADHATVVGFERKNAGVVPVFDAGDSGALAAWGRERFQASILATARYLELSRDVVQWEADLRPAVRRGVELLWEQPTYGEAVTVGKYPFESGEAKARMTQPLARRYSLNDVILGGLSGSYPDRSWTRWHAASVELSSKSVRLVDAAFSSIYRHIGRPQKGALSHLLRSTWARRRSSSYDRRSRGG